jgi:chorismate mutase
MVRHRPQFAPQSSLTTLAGFLAKARRYTRPVPVPLVKAFPRLIYDENSPDEYPFTGGLPDPILTGPEYPAILHPNKINVNASILSFYIRTIVPRISTQATLTLACLKRSRGIIGDDELEDDGNYGSAATVDVEVLQAISKRVHYGPSSRPLISPSALESNPLRPVPCR